MTSDALIHEFRTTFPDPLPLDLVTHFMAISSEVRGGVTERVSGGKFIETVVQCLQFLEKGSIDAQPQVDAYLKNLESAAPRLPDDLRITLCRIARACYTIRNKRNVAHKGDVEPNVYDLRFMFSGCQWILSELLRHSSKIDKSAAGRLIEFIQIPATEIVESIGTTRIVHANLDVQDEIILLLNSYYPEFANREDIEKSLCRRINYVSYNLEVLYFQKFIHLDLDYPRYKLTKTGVKRALEIMKKL